MFLRLLSLAYCSVFIVYTILRIILVRIASFLIGIKDLKLMAQVDHPTCSVLKVPPNPCTTVNLTGNLRKLRDSCADFYNCAQKFNNAIVSGLPKVKELAEIILKDRECEDSEPLITQNQIQELCYKLSDDQQDMETAVIKMEKITNQMKPLSVLMVAEHKRTANNPSLTDEEELVPMQTWPITKFYEEMKCIASMYREELFIKTEVWSNICHQKTAENVKCCVILWKFQSQVNKCKLNLEGLVIECGLKSF